uniref:DUF7595 domain-containing protein n=1 Tax=Aegilops tauschii TaxID=37682 RepID=M8BAA5_AEGTA
MATELQRAALRLFEQRRRGRDEGVVIIDDSNDDDDAPPPPPAGEGSSRGARVKEEKADDAGDDGDFSAFSKGRPWGGGWGPTRPRPIFFRRVTPGGDFKRLLMGQRLEMLLARLRVCDALTGHFTSLPPIAVPSNTFPDVFLSVGDGGSFELLLADRGMRFRIFSSLDGKWGVLRQASPRDINMAGAPPSPIGRTVYYSCCMHEWDPNRWDQIVALDVEAAKATTMELPPGCRTRKRFSKRPMHLLLASVHGRLSLFVTEIHGIAMWTLKPDSSGSVAAWSRHLVIGNQEIKRQTGLEESYHLKSPRFSFHGFGERSGSMIMSLGKA